jgi:aminopeptidase N
MSLSILAAMMMLAPTDSLLVTKLRARTAVWPDEHAISTELDLELPCDGARISIHRDLVVSNAAGLINDDTKPAPGQLQHHRASARKVHVSLRGTIHQPPTQVSTEHQRSFAETSGIIDHDGVYLPPQSGWLPLVSCDDRNTYTTGHIQVTAPPGWRAIVDGGEDATRTDGAHLPARADGVHLVAGAFFVQTEDVPRFRVEDPQAKRVPFGNHSFTGPLVVRDPVHVSTWLRNNNDEAKQLHRRYADSARESIALYSSLLGAYPYNDFVLVENFWETGYGMAGFTLLGPQVIRLPFIASTSFPHEILHNWWGNGVFADPQDGNWTEGLTAYLADALHADWEGRGDEHRRTTLERYRDFVGANPAAELSLQQFRNRDSAATEAVGYGKMAMLMHMVRTQLGDDKFTMALRKLYDSRHQQRTGLDALRAVFVEHDASVGPTFDAFVGRVGAPRFEHHAIIETKSSGVRVLDVEVRQTQATDAFPMQVPVEIAGVGGVQRMMLRCEGRRCIGRAVVNSPVAAVSIDPHFEVFRVLGKDESPLALSRALGSQRMTWVLPSRASAQEQAAWRALSEQMCAAPAMCTVVDDASVPSLPSGSVWVLGANNMLRGPSMHQLGGADVIVDDRGLFAPGARERIRASKDKLLAIRQEVIEAQKSSVVAVRPHPGDDTAAVVWVRSATPASIAALGKKLGHYGRYGWLVFQGTDDAKIAHKGAAAGAYGPNTRMLDSSATPATTPVGPMPTALAQAPTTIPWEQMLARAADLADLEGRGAKGKRVYAGFLITSALQASGAPKPTLECTPAKQSILRVPDDVCNIVVTLPATTDKPGAPIVVGAHYDHLGIVKSTTYPGADDNASGVAVLLGLVDALRTQPWTGSHPLRVVFFDREEMGLVGSRADVKTHASEPPFAMINLDMVGRRNEGGWWVFDSDSAAAWPGLIDKVTRASKLTLRKASVGGGGSDQQAYREAGIPAIQLSSGLHSDYHKPTDTADKLEPAAMVEALQWTLMMLREVAVTADMKAAVATPATSATSAPRSVTLGTVPDMSHAGSGVRIQAATPGGPAALAGLQAGDVIIRIGGTAITDLRAMSVALKQLAPGDVVTVTVMRGTATVDVKATVAARP